MKKSNSSNEVPGPGKTSDPDSEVKTGMKFVRFVAWAYMFIAPLAWGFFSEIEFMSAAILNGFLLMAFAYMDKIKKFKGGGFEAELREAVTKAYATIEKLRSVAISLSEPIVTEVTMQNRTFQYIPLKYRYERIQDIENSLRDLGVSKEEIEKTTSFFYSAFHEDHVKRIVFAVLKDEDAPDPVKEALEPYKEKDDLEDFEFKNVAGWSEYKPSKVIDELLLDLKHFDSEKSFRRIDTWQ
jgi:hypothetical protein